MNPFVIAFRRIIYSIPLKRLLVGLAVFSVLLASFSSAGLELVSTSYATSNGSAVAYNSPDGVDMTCIKYDYSKTSCQGVQFKFKNDTSPTLILNNHNNVINDIGGIGYCTTDGYVRRASFGNESCGVNYYNYRFTNYTSLECQTEYNLIPIESVDQQYCTTNNLCPTYDCPVNPIGTGSLSNLYINNILHIGAPNIIMNIPEEIDWDYAYTMGGNTMNIDIVGYNQDQELIQGWIDTNNYKPSSDDFTNIFTNFSNFGGLLIATLFVILVFYFVKKMFK